MLSIDPTDLKSVEIVVLAKLTVYLELNMSLSLVNGFSLNAQSQQ